MEPWCPQPYFVDKSKVVKHFLRSRHKVLMISAPQGFLKSTNMRLMATFVDGISSQAVTDRRKALWQETGLRIMKEADLIDEFFGQWPYLHLTLPLAGSSCFADAMVATVRQLYSRHKSIPLSGRLSPTQRFNFEIYQQFSFGKGEGTGDRKLADAVTVLCDALSTCYEKPVYVFIDNYDFPLLETLAKGKPMVNVQPFLGRMIASLYQSKSVKKVLLNGISGYTATKEDAPVKVYRFLHEHKFTKYYCFVEDDILSLVNKNRCSYEIARQMLSQHYLTVSTGVKVYSPEWSLDFLKHNLIENPIWFEEIFRKTVMTTVSMHQQLAPLRQGKTGRAMVLQPTTHSDLMQLNRLLNSDVPDLEPDEVQLIMKLLFDFGVFTPVEASATSFSVPCYCSSADVIKIRTIDTSRLTAQLPVSLYTYSQCA